MDILFDFHPFVFGGVTEKGHYSASLPLKTPPSEVVATHGRLFGIFSLHYPDIFPLDTIAKEIVPHFEQTYYENECHSPHSHLVQSLSQTQSYLEKRILEVNGADSVEFSMLVGCVWGKVLYIARCGGLCSLRLYREDTFGILFDLNSSSGSSSVASISGFIQPMDVIVLHDRVVDPSKFPLTTSSLASLDDQVIYSKLTKLFDLTTNDASGGSISGFYVKAESVPSVEEERIFFADIHHERDLDVASRAPIQEELPDDSEEVIEEHKPEAPQLFNKVLQGRASVSTFGSRVFSQFRFTHKGLFSRIHAFLALFTRGRVFVIGCMFLILFLGFIFAGKPYESTFKKEKKTDELKVELVPKIEEAYKQGQYYAELNPERAKKYLREAQDYISQFGGAVTGDAELARLRSSVQDAYAIVTKTYLIQNASPFFDLTTINPQATGAKLAISEESLLATDIVQSTVYKIGGDTRSARPVMGKEDITGIISAEGDGGTVYAVSPQVIVRTQEKDSSVVRLKEAEGEWGTITDMQVFGGSVYLLDQGRNQIWKYIPEGGAFAPVRNYISSESEVNLSGAISLSIDGNVWVGFSNGIVHKFYQGKKDPFDLAKIDTPLASLKGIYTDENTDYLYVLDDSVGRVVVFSKKDGSYISSYESEQFKGATDIVVDKSYLYILHKNLIYRVELREKPDSTHP